MSKKQFGTGKAHGVDREKVLDVEVVTREVQEAFAPFRAKEGSVVDELIAERRIEARKETIRSANVMPAPRIGVPGQACCGHL